MHPAQRPGCSYYISSWSKADPSTVGLTGKQRHTLHAHRHTEKGIEMIYHLFYCIHAFSVVFYISHSSLRYYLLLSLHKNKILIRKVFLKALAAAGSFCFCTCRWWACSWYIFQKNTSCTKWIFLFYERRGKIIPLHLSLAYNMNRYYHCFFTAIFNTKPMNPTKWKPMTLTYPK